MTALRMAPAVDDIAGFQILLHHLDDAATGGARKCQHLRRIGLDRSASRQRHAERLANHMHGIGGAHAGANAGSLHRHVRHAGEVVERDLAGGEVAGLKEDLLDIDMLAPIGTAALIAADHHNGRNIHPARRHELAGERLVTGGEAHHPVEQGALDLHFDVGGDEIARRQNVGAVSASAGDEITRRGGANLKRQSTGVANLALHFHGDAVEMGKTARQLG